MGEWKLVSLAIGSGEPSESLRDLDFGEEASVNGSMIFSDFLKTDVDATPKRKLTPAVAAMIKTGWDFMGLFAVTKETAEKLWLHGFLENWLHFSSFTSRSAVGGRGV
jgi:hypothetical protein